MKRPTHVNGKRITQAQRNRADMEMDRKLGIKQGSKLDLAINKLTGAKIPPKSTKGR